VSDPRDKMLEREIEEALAVNPSPEFIDRMRRRHATIPIASAWNLQRRLLLAAAAVIALAVLIPVVIFRNTVVHGKTPAIIETGDGSLSSGGQARPFQPGQQIEYGDVIRSSGIAGAVITLADGSRVEMRTASEISLKPAADGVQISLGSGSVIVNAAKQRSGHLYVQTRDCTVSVVGTVFLVTADAVGSRVAVIQGEVHVQHGPTLNALLPGQQITTAASMKNFPVAEEISWSRFAAAHLMLLKESEDGPVAALPESGAVAGRPENTKDAGSAPERTTIINPRTSAEDGTVGPAAHAQTQETAAAPLFSEAANIRPKAPGLETTSGDRPADVIRVNVEMVQAYTTVTDVKGRFVTNLKAGNFRVSEDGKEQQIDAFSSDDSPLSVGILFDVNGTMGDNLPLAKEAALSFLKAGNFKNEYFLLEFNDKPQITVDYTNDLGKLKNHTSLLRRSRNDGAMDAIYAGLEKLRNAKNPRKVLLVFTTGGDLKNEHKIAQVRNLAAQLDVQIYGISIADINAHGYDEGTSGMEVVDSVGGEVFAPDTGADFLTTCRKIAVALRNQYVIGYQSTNAAHDGKYRRLKVKLTLDDAPELFVHTRGGYYARGPER
jgi:Ca-activated chloride channel homolog